MAILISIISAISSLISVFFGVCTVACCLAAGRKDSMNGDDDDE